MHKSTLILASAFIFPLVSGAAIAQDEARKNNPSDPDIELPANPYLSYSKPREWMVRQTIYLMLPQGVFVDQFDRVRTEQYGSFPGEIEFVYPFIQKSGSSWSMPDDLPTGSVFLNDKNQDLEYTLGYASGTHAPYTKWTIKVGDQARVLKFDMISSVISVDTDFNEKEALKLDWSDQWDAATASFLTPILDSHGEHRDESEILITNPDTEFADERVIESLLDQWTEGKDAQSIPPVLLAKYLTGKVIEHVRYVPQSLLGTDNSGFSSAIKHNNGPGGSYNFVYTGFYAGFAVRRADLIAQEQWGSRYDLSVLLTSVFRAAGLPARTMLGVDNAESGDDRIRSWVEFALYDPALDLTIWVPVDPDELRRRGARSSQYERPWKYFGTNDLLHEVAPISHYFHPPAAYQSFEYPALYGIRAQQEIPYFTEQIITFGINRKPIRGAPKDQGAPKP